MPSLFANTVGYRDKGIVLNAGLYTSLQRCVKVKLYRRLLNLLYYYLKGWLELRYIKSL